MFREGRHLAGSFHSSRSLPRHRDPSYALGLVSNAFRRNAARTLVCTLPLLHFSPSLVAVVHLGPSSLSNDVRSLNSSSSAPAFRRAGSLACRLVGSELPCESHRFRSSHKSMSRLSLFGFQWALGDSRSVRNPLGLFRKLSLLKRRILSSVARVPMMTSRRSSSHHSRASR